MLSVGRREDGRQGLGFGGGGMDEDNELEEGEACSGQEDDPSIDPDALSYIDEKIQDVLGHFQKDFEAGVSAENLGAKFGGYGSFLPTHQRSPSILCQPRSPQKLPNQNVTRSPYKSTVEVTNQDNSVTMSSPFPRNNTVAVSLLDNSYKTDSCVNKPNVQEPSSECSSFNKTTNGTDHKTLKVRIKMVDNNLARNNAAIYSGLGLDYSPSSSFEDSPDGNEGVFPGFRDLSDESPGTIIQQVMTCFAVPGGFLLSPLQDNLFHLTEKDISYIKQSKRHKSYKGLPETTIDFADSTTHSREVKGQMKQTKARGLKGRPSEIKDSEGKDNITFGKEIESETHSGREPTSSSFNMPASSISKNAIKEARPIVGNAVKIDTKLLDQPSEMKKTSLKDQSSFTGSVKELFESTPNNDIDNSGNEVMNSRGQLNAKVSMSKKALEERNKDYLKDKKSDLQRERRSNIEKDLDITDTHSSGHKRSNEQVSVLTDRFKPGSSPSRERILQQKEQRSDRKKKLKVSHTNSEPFGEILKDNVSGNVIATTKEKKKASHSKADNAQKKSKVLKPRKDLSGSSFSESHGNVIWDVKAEEFENGVGLLNRSKGKQKAVKCKHEKKPIVSTQASKEMSGCNKVEDTPISGAFVIEPILAPLACNAPVTDATVAPQPPVVIEEHWVCCDICQKWRLLPYGTNPGHLPTKWQCKLLSWLPGMNRCDVSEEETTNALHALYLAPAPENGASLEGRDVAAPSASLTSGVRLGQNLELHVQNVPITEKKKSALKDASSIPTHSTPTQIPNFVKKDEQAFVKSRSSNDTNLYLHSEIDSSSKGGLGNTSRLTDFGVEKHKPKQKDKHKNRRGNSDGGDHCGKNKKHSKSENQRGIDQDDLRTSKKAGKESLQYTNKSCTSDNVTAKAFEVTDVGGYSTKVITNDHTRWDNNPFLKDSKCDTKSNSSAPFKKSRDEVQSITNCESKDHVSASDVEKYSNLDVSVKKRKMKEWQESQQNQEGLVSRQHVGENGVIVKGALGENEPVKDRNFELLLSERKRSKTSKLNSKMDKNYTMTKMSLRASGEHIPDGMDEALYVVEKEHRFSQSQENAASLRELDFDSLKRDIAYAQPPVAANSSSSMVSGSHKSRSNLRETKGSPVESVSSSPLRILGIQKPSCKRTSEQKDYAINPDSSLLESPKRCSDGEVDGGNGHSGKFRKQISIQQQSFESHRVAGSGTLDSLGETFDYLEKEKILLSVGKSEERLHVKNGASDDFSPTELGEQHPYKYDIQDLGKVNKDHLVNESIQRKSSKSSLSSKGKHRGSKSDLGKNKPRVSGPYTVNKDFHSTNNGSSCRFEATSGYCEDGKDDFDEKDEKDSLGKKEPTSRWTTSRQYNSTNFTVQDNVDSNAPIMHSSQQKDIESKVPVCGSRHIKPEFQVKPSFHNGKELDHNHLDRIDFPEPPSGLGKSQLKLTAGCKQDTQYRIPHMVSSPLKASRLDVGIVDAVNADGSKVVKQHRQPEIHHRSHQTNMRHATPNGPDTSSPLRKEHYSAVMKEARDLKHSANRLKSEGLELESTGLYFEAALKFLHVAALMEPVNLDSVKQAEAAQMYFETAKLCEFVAHEYEKVKDTAAAALAYKCVEVAHLKSAYCKNPNASKDRHELQAALQFLPPGESPSSSASDVDNLNNQIILGKNASTKAVSSPQVAGNHVIAARHHHQVMRLLHYTNYLNCAFEATRKAHICLAAAVDSFGKDRVDCLSSVRKALNFNFHNVDGLLRHVRLSLDSIGR
ncbi:unnamed protein product [Musa acuminata var. zebrina]